MGPFFLRFCQRFKVILSAFLSKWHQKLNVKSSTVTFLEENVDAHPLGAKVRKDFSNNGKEQTDAFNLIFEILPKAL